MKLIDEKGRLFGKVNVVDLIVLVIIVGVIGAVGYRLTSSRVNVGDGNPVTTEKQYCYVTLYSSLVVPEISQELHVGDKLVANSKYTDAEIVSIDEKPAAYVAVNSDGEAVLSEHPIWKDVTVVVREKIDPTSVILKVGNQEARVGYSYILKTQTVETNCKIRGVEFKDD
jgi:hypothetical protein